MGEQKKAIYYLENALEIFRNKLGLNHPYTLGAKESLRQASFCNRTNKTQMIH